ncbi:YALI0B16302p [Yarrowia lipolytica CLIB122]|uniref:YALI0B16302p n=2 Tax=Yarrowia lipolytica TaxID=4952 RepID=Q6CEE4_YARLI|nr:YALI0B16302p [Yarrowia lipolytica CLIB122]AOW01787.1 hypothetical protein YALI1_B21275g [Yarrowia lipolytica]KAB8285024.1 hypothetical protein BKA91DRAFT_134213 [Yarrowia lipolytica]KAE8175052.1 hypothetical protein BKA90DRAFT_132806 [Yarrowia lipolytica]KAJ8052580.1 hypothetical protein LXG23DRAFT_52062 [Yarrowia lipolytica]RMJ01321.1 hypothetical protein BD777DRAFT_122165 [Yarrowia lipolytica]|eukprot:XP_500968.1 YALI0B16302p [Yarrowia lipolytica CLIB122]
MALLDLFNKKQVEEPPFDISGQDVLRLLTATGMLTPSPDQEFYVTGTSISTREQIAKEIKQQLRESLEPVTVGLLSAKIGLDAPTTQIFVDLCLPQVQGVVQDGYNYYSWALCEQLLSQLDKSLDGNLFVSSLDFCHKNKMSWKLLSSIASKQYLVEDGVVLDQKKWAQLQKETEEKLTNATQVLPLSELLEEETGSTDEALKKVFINTITRWLKNSGKGRISGDKFIPDSHAQGAQNSVKYQLESTGYVSSGALKQLRKKLEVVAQEMGLNLTALSDIVVNDAWADKRKEEALSTVADQGYIDVGKVDFCREVSVEDNKTLVDGFIKAASKSKACDSIRNGPTVEFVVEKNLNSNVKVFAIGDICEQLAKAETAAILKANSVQDLSDKSAEGFVDQHVISDVYSVPADSLISEKLAAKFPQLPKRLLQLYVAQYRALIQAGTKEKTIALVRDECEEAVVTVVTYLLGLKGVLQADKKVGKKLVDGAMAQIKDNVACVDSIALDSEMSKLENKVTAQIDALWACVRVDDHDGRVKQCQSETLRNLKTQVGAAAQKGKSALALHLAVTVAMSQATPGILLSSGSTVPRQVKFLRKQALLDAAQLDFLDKAVEVAVKNEPLDEGELNSLMEAMAI